LSGLIGATIVVFFARGQTPAIVILLSLTIFAAAAIGVAMLRTLAPLTARGGPDVPQVLGGRTRAALERDKALVLRSIKDLEFDRAMGKVSEKDFVIMTARLRARATRILRQLDAGTGYREQIEKEIAKRLGEKALPPELDTRTASVRQDDDVGSAGQDSADSTYEVGERTGEIRLRSASQCASCGTQNDPDARFCKSCGTSMGDGR
jgi:hypothetical protein